MLRHRLPVTQDPVGAESRSRATRCRVVAALVAAAFLAGSAAVGVSAGTDDDVVAARGRSSRHATTAALVDKWPR